MKKIIFILLSLGTFLSAASLDAFVVIKKIENCPEAMCLTFDEDGKELFVVAYDEFANNFYELRERKISDGMKFYITYEQDKYENILKSYDHLD